MTMIGHILVLFGQYLVGALDDRNLCPEAGKGLCHLDGDWGRRR